VYRPWGNSKYSYSRISAVSLEISVSWSMTPCSSVDTYQVVLRHITHRSILGLHIFVWKGGNTQNEKWPQIVLPQRCYVYTKLHSVTFQKSVTSVYKACFENMWGSNILRIQHGADRKPSVEKISRSQQIAKHLYNILRRSTYPVLQLTDHNILFIARHRLLTWRCSVLYIIFLGWGET
jgi:hypothetical protein